MDFGDISKEIAKRWKNLSPEERGVWINKAKEEKARWEEEHGSVQEYKLQQQAAMDMPSAQEKKVQDMHSKYSAFAYFKRVFNKKQPRLCHECGKEVKGMGIIATRSAGPPTRT